MKILNRKKKMMIVYHVPCYGLTDDAAKIKFDQFVDDYTTGKFYIEQFFMDFEAGSVKIETFIL